MTHAPAVPAKSISIVMEGGSNVKRKFLLALLVVLVSCPAYCGDLMDSSALNMRPVEDMDMSGVLPAYVNPSGTFLQSEAEAPSYNLPNMKRLNPDFTTYPEADGIIWLKHVVYSRGKDGGMQIYRLYVILGRRGLGGKWLNWNIPIPARGSARVLEACVYDFNSLARVSNISPQEDTDAGILAVNFQGLPETFILAVSWREDLPEAMNFEGLCWTQESLRIWESIVDVYSSQPIAYKTFPDHRRPESEKLMGETVYTWRRINVDPHNDSAALARLPRSGVAFSDRHGMSSSLGIARSIEDSGRIPPASEALSAFKRGGKSGAVRLVEWLMRQPEIELAEGSPRKIPAKSPLTRDEKVIVACVWLAGQNANVVLNWRIPFEPDDITPLCEAMFVSPVLEVKGVKEFAFHDMRDPKLLAGVKIFGVSGEGKIYSQRVPSSRPSDNRLSAIMDLRLSEYGLISGTVRVILRGGWGALLLGNNPTDGTARGAVLSLFPGLTNYKDVAYKNVKGVPELSFTVENKPGVGGTGRGILAIPPFFEPAAMRALGTYDAPVEIRFPFIVEQNITLGFPKNATEALVSNKVPKNPDKINYTENYVNRRHRLIADSRFELDMPSVSAGNMSLLQRHLNQWRAFSSRQIPVR